MLGLDISREIMSQDRPSFKKADEAMDFLLNQGKLHLYDTSLCFLLVRCLLKTTAEFLLTCSLFYHLFLDLSGPKVRIKVETSLAVDKIENIAHNDGLQPDQIENLVKFAASGKYGKFQLISRQTPANTKTLHSILVLLLTYFNLP